MPRIVPSEVAAAIETTYPWAKKAADGEEAFRDSLGPDQGPHVAMILALLDALPSELAPDSAGGLLTIEAAKGAMRGALGAWASGAHAGSLPKLSPLAACGGKHPIVAVLEVLRGCQDEAATAAAADLHFITDPEARRSLREDISAAHRAQGNGEYKAATVLAGSVLEALLLTAISGRPSTDRDAAVKSVAVAKGRAPDSRGPEWWHLPDYIAVARQLDIIDDSLASLLTLSAEYRNLIHPGRVLRRGHSCTRGTALSALGAMERLIEQLS